MTFVSPRVLPPGLPAWLDELAARGCITLARNRFNLGFIETCNRGLRARRGHDVVLFDAQPKAGGLNEYGLAAY